MILKKNKTLNIHYYNAIKKAIFKPSAFFKGIILPLAQDCTAKEAAIIGSILKKCSIPVAHSSACLMKLIELCGKEIKMGCLFFMKIILLKKYALPTQVKVGLINFFMKFMDVSYEQSHPKIEDLNKSLVINQHRLPVLWHQTLLVFIQFYKFDFSEEENMNLKELVNKQSHHLITDDLLRELNYKPGKFLQNMQID